MQNLITDTDDANSGHHCFAESPMKGQNFIREPNSIRLSYEGRLMLNIGYFINPKVVMEQTLGGNKRKLLIDLISCFEVTLPSK